MTEQRNNHSWLTAAECAERMGLTVRALRLYEARGLIKPHRTGKNWRLYGISDVARLHEILTLKRMGLSLAHITRLLAGHAVDLDRTLAMQQAALVALRTRAEEGLSLIRASRHRIAAGETITIQDLINIARETDMTHDTADAIAWRRYEQTRPRTEVPIAPSLYARYVGSYRFPNGSIMTVSIREGGLAAQLTGQNRLDIFPDAENLFFYRAVAAQLSFAHKGGEAAETLILHQNGYQQAAQRIDERLAHEVAVELETRIREKRPITGSEDRLLGLIGQAARGEYDFARMTEPLAAATREQADTIRTDLERAGAMKSSVFKGVSSEGWDVYEVAFENETMEWRFILADDGRMSGAWIRPLP